MSRFINPVPQFFLNDGSLASSGRMKFFANKDYSTLKDTYAESDNTVANTNPIILDGSGRMPACFGEGLYSVKFYKYDPTQVDGLGELQWSRDDVTLSQLTGQFEDWSALETYRLGDTAKASDGFFYESLSNGNKGNNPLTSGTFWAGIVFATEWRASVTYPINKIVAYLGRLYRSNTNGNLNNTPPSSQWDDLSFNNAVTGDFSVTGNITAGGTIGGGYVPISAKKVIDTSRGSTTTLSADPELSITNLLNSSWYSVRALIVWDGSGSTVNGIKIRIGTTNCTLFSSLYMCSSNTTTANSGITGNVNTGVPAGFEKLPSFSGATDLMIIEATVVTSGAGVPSIFVEWSQSASNATVTRVKTSSRLTVSKL